MIATYASIAEILIGAGILALCLLLYRPLKAHAAAHGNRHPEKLFTLDELFLQSWMVAIFLGFGLIIFGLVG